MRRTSTSRYCVSDRYLNVQLNAINGITEVTSMLATIIYSSTFSLEAPKGTNQFHYSSRPQGSPMVVEILFGLYMSLFQNHSGIPCGS